jgi:hypothetical protein
VNSEYERKGKAASIVIRPLIAHISNHAESGESRFQIGMAVGF